MNHRFVSNPVVLVRSRRLLNLANRRRGTDRHHVQARNYQVIRRGASWLIVTCSLEDGSAP